ncbi:amidohydrolase family protein [uncultured Aureimonas sp.]|uniref:amidohydrolase family protein n=1 Tax=uncultured Aureimonas sp. TaxID=1604662 RepID=UPI0025E2A9D5|nr:amidohydrolase family protein [uncultured Aureimonas sp.]
MRRAIACVAYAWVVAVGAMPSAAQEREAVVLSGGYVLSFDPAVGDLRQGDILVRGGVIAEIAPRIEAPGATRVDLAGKLVLPGLIDTHTHLWTSSMKGRFQNTPQSAYFAVKAHLGRHFTPEDVRIATYYGAVETLASGVTTTVDLFHNNRGAEFFEASRQALVDSGLRARLLFGAHDDTPPDETADLERLGTLAAEWRDSRVTLGFGWRGTGTGSEQLLATGRTELAAVRTLGLPIAVHASGETVAPLAASGLLGPDVQIIHATGASPEELRIFAEAGASLALTPVTEQRVGYGVIALRDLEPMERIGLGIDGPGLAGAADLFANIRLLALNEAGASGEEGAVSPRRILELATRDAARAIGMDDEIGSLAPGKRADIIAIDLQALGMAPLPDGDPAALVVYSAQPADVDLVMVDGEIRNRDGQLLGVDVPRILGDVERSIRGVADRAGGWPAVRD